MTFSSIPHWWCCLVTTLIAQSTWVHVTNNSVFHHQVCIFYHINKCQYLPRQIYKCLYLPRQIFTNVSTSPANNPSLTDRPEKWFLDRPPLERPVKTTGGCIAKRLRSQLRSGSWWVEHFSSRITRLAIDLLKAKKSTEDKEKGGRERRTCGVKFYLASTGSTKNSWSSTQYVQHYSMMIFCSIRFLNSACEKFTRAGTAQAVFCEESFFPCSAPSVHPSSHHVIRWRDERKGGDSGKDGRQTNRGQKMREYQSKNEGDSREGAVINQKKNWTPDRPWRGSWWPFLIGWFTNSIAKLQ